MAHPNKEQWVESLGRLVLERARALIDDERTWERHRFALDENARDVSVTSADAVRFCAQAALTRASYDIVGTDIPALDYRKLACLAGDCIVGYEALGQVNASRGRKRVLKLIDGFLDEEKTRALQPPCIQNP